MARPTKQPERFHDAAVYLMRNKKTGAAYVGASLRVSERMNAHRKMILTKKFQSTIYGHHFAGCTNDDLEFEILERAQIPMSQKGGLRSPAWLTLHAREKQWIQKLKPEVNECYYFDKIDSSSLPTTQVEPPPRDDDEFDGHAPALIHEFSAYNESFDDRVIVYARSHIQAARRAHQLRGWPMADVIVRYRKSVEASALTAMEPRAA
jgi:hypothetical protein